MINLVFYNKIQYMEYVKFKKIKPCQWKNLHMYSVFYSKVQHILAKT